MERLNIAICGSGLASLCLAHALSKHTHLQVKIFEASPVFRDDGAAYGLGSNAQEALALISPELRNALDEAGGVRMDPSLRLMMGTGPLSGRHIGDARPALSQVITHRGHFLQAIRKLVPDGVVQMGKKLVDAKTAEDGQVELQFEDGTSHVADALVGCDGINSFTRRVVLGLDHPAVDPVYGSGYNHRVVLPLQTAIEAFGEDYCKMRTQHGWVGDGGFLLTDLVDDGRAMQVITGWATKEPWPHDAPYVEWPKDSVRKNLESWGSIGHAMTKILTEQPKLYAAGRRVHLDTSTYCKGSICIAGDAAQAFTPFQGAGAGQAIEDALILSNVLGSSKTRSDLVTAFEVYDSIRRPRRADIARSSLWTGKWIMGRAENVGLDADLLAKQIETWGSNIYEYDLITAQQQALRQLAEATRAANR